MMAGSDHDEAVMSEINMTPLVDVMLVLLVIFIITLPVLQGAVKIDLPSAATQPNDQRPAHIDLYLAADGRVRWNHENLSETTLAARLQAEAQRRPQPEIHLYADRKTPYENLAGIMAQAQSAGLQKMGFVTDKSAAPQTISAK